MHTTRAAVEEGIVAGGGVAFIRTTSAVSTLKLAEDEQQALTVCCRALKEPCVKLPRTQESRGRSQSGKSRPTKKTLMDSMLRLRLRRSRRSGCDRSGEGCADGLAEWALRCRIAAHD